MAAGRPAGEKIEVEYTAGVWTDVSGDSMDDPFTIQRGRTSEFSQPSTGQLSGLRLKNTNGQYTPLSQVLADGTANANYPNIIPRKRIRYSNTPAGVRGVGYVKGWPPFVDSDGTKWVAITATDRLDQLSRIVLKSPIAQEISQDIPNRSWQLTDPVGALSAADAVGSSAVLSVRQQGAGGPLVFGDVGPGSGDGTGVKFAPASSSAGQYLSGAAPSGWAGRADATVELWVELLSTPGATQAVCAIDGTITGADWVYLGIDNTGKPLVSLAGTTITGSASIVGGWHLLTLTRTVSGFNGTYTLYVDGVAVGSPTVVTVTGATILNVGQTALTANASALFAGNIGYVSTYLGALSASRIADHHAAGLGYYGDTTDQRIARWLTAGGLTSSDWNLDTGKAIVNTYPQSGKDIVSACQDMATTEGGGSVFYVGTDGKALFRNRAFRKPGAPVMTIDAEADLDASVYAPSFDELTLFNQSTGNRAAQSGTLSSQTYTDPVSSAAPPTGYGLTTDGPGVTSYATTDQDVLNLAQARVAANAYPGFRLPQVAVDLVTAQNNLYAALASVEIGSRIRVTNLPVAMAPSTQIDLIVEGWSETIGPDTYKVVFDTSPADSPARGIWDDTSYGGWQCSGQTLNANITNSATTLAIATAGTLPTFTTVGARYPLKIQIGQEIITLNSAPGGSTSPQTFTGVTRGVNGTSAAAQTAGAVVTLWPAATWTL
jgi:hypothetical protein